MQTRSGHCNTDEQWGSELENNPEFPELHYVMFITRLFFPNKSVLLKEILAWYGHNNNC